ncbi:TRAP transporter small permease [Azospirillum halopraeferens]|uniref:TRAP transporter small permease n=1 Tax=Azospirillum halopraeferens TaxID=34010 RepID=UPI00040AA421|nr:TRAP transporter small permease [Azospirillum halopraeferens]
MAIPGKGSALARALSGVVIACRTAAILFLVLMTGLVVAQVAGRNLFNQGMAWADELARFSGIALVFLAIPVLALRGQHVAVDLLARALPARGRRAIGIVNELLVFALCGLTLYALHAFLGRAGGFVTPALGMPNWLFYAPVVAGYLLTGLVTLARIVDPALRAGAEEGEMP